MWASMSSSTSLSSVTFGLANTAKPTLRSASTHGRTTSVLPGTTLVKTQASATASGPATSSSQRPTASKRGRNADVGRAPSSEPRLMSMFGASQTSSTRSGRSGSVSGHARTGSGRPYPEPNACPVDQRRAERRSTGGRVTVRAAELGGTGGPARHGLRCGRGARTSSPGAPAGAASSRPRWWRCSPAAARPRTPPASGRVVGPVRGEVQDAAREPAGRRPARRNLAGPGGACGAAASATGRGRRSAPPAREPGGTRSRRRSTASPRSSRRFVSPALLDAHEQLRQPGLEDLDGEVVGVRRRGGLGRGRLPGARADLEDQRGAAPEPGRRVVGHRPGHDVRHVDPVHAATAVPRRAPAPR